MTSSNTSRPKALALTPSARALFQDHTVGRNVLVRKCRHGTLASLRGFNFRYTDELVALMNKTMPGRGEWTGDQVKADIRARQAAPKLTKRQST